MGKHLNVHELDGVRVPVNLDIPDDTMVRVVKEENGNIQQCVVGGDPRDPRSFGIIKLDDVLWVTYGMDPCNHDSYVVFLVKNPYGAIGVNRLYERQPRGFNSRVVFRDKETGVHLVTIYGRNQKGHRSYESRYYQDWRGHVEQITTSGIGKKTNSTVEDAEDIKGIRQYLKTVGRIDPTELSTWYLKSYDEYLAWSKHFERLLGQKEVS